MRQFQLPSWSRWWQSLEVGAPDQEQRAARIRYMEVYLGLPVKALVIAMLLYYFFFSNWSEAFLSPGSAGDLEIPPREVALDVVRFFFLIYVALNVAGASLLLGMEQVPLVWIQRVVFSIAWIDALSLSVVAAITDHTILFWVFLGLIVRNAVSVPDGGRQILLNGFVAFCYVLAGAVESLMDEWEYHMLDFRIQQALDSNPQPDGAEPILLRLMLLILMSICCYGVQVLLEKQRRAEQESREFSMRQEQLQAAGRLAAEIAHQLKNPLGIINNASFNLQRTAKEGKTITQQLQIIREEVERSDRILTELMGYAQLGEGVVEKVDVVEELERAIEQVFPPGTYPITIERDYGPALPALLVQRAHVLEIFANLLQNAREAMEGQGRIWVNVAYGESYTVVVTIRDDGPGIPEEVVQSIFEPYFTTKPKGTGLGLAIVKHNTEIYGGAVSVQSSLGKGTVFTVRLPAKTLMRVRR